ncbi:MAG TPA: EAL domain-containing protein [Burkholderiales bacterium]|nr:EAL domain-containing protein [Burkholderiales bacterium]
MRRLRAFRPRLLPLAAPLVIIAGALAVLLVAGMEIFSAARDYVAGSELWTRELLVHFLLAAGVSLVIAAVLMTQRALQRIAAAENALRQSEERMRLVADNVPALIAYVDQEERFRYGNRVYGEWLGAAPEAMVGRTVEEVFGAEAYARMKEPIRRVLAGEEVEFELGGAGGARRTLQIACVPQAGERRETRGFYMLGSDVTPLKRAQEDLRFAAIQLQQDAQRLEFLAHHDPLTGLPNRAMFADRAREAVAHARRHGKNLAFLFLDLDNFKQINDSLGHEVGDTLLKSIAQRLRATVRGDDFVARIGGDEFCVLLQDVADPREAAAVAQKLVHELSAPHAVGVHELRTGASIGIACVPIDGEDVPTLMRLADTAMYRAKEKGRNGYQFFSAALGEDAAAAAALAEELRAGIERNELFLVYQPRVDAATRQVLGAEALLRWNHPRLGVLKPESFLPLADDTGLLVPIGAWVLREACAQGRRWIDAGIHPLTVVVNVTARQLRHGSLGELVHQALHASGLPGDALLIELPEAAVRQIPDALEHAMRGVVETGARLGVDDFGTGYASLPMLQRLQVDGVCIDRQLIAGVPADAERGGLARALITLARGLEFEVVAKGVETAAQRDFLIEAGCRILQGDLFGAPSAAPEIEPVLRARRAA